MDLKSVSATTCTLERSLVSQGSTLPCVTMNPSVITLIRNLHGDGSSMLLHRLSGKCGTSRGGLTTLAYATGSSEPSARRRIMDVTSGGPLLCGVAFNELTDAIVSDREEGSDVGKREMPQFVRHLAGVIEADIITSSKLSRDIKFSGCSRALYTLPLTFPVMPTVPATTFVG